MTPTGVLSQRVVRLRLQAEEIATNVALPLAADVDRERRWPAHTFRALADAGLMGLHVPEELGGCGEGLVALAAMTETLAQGCPSSAICYGMHCVGSAVIAAKPTDYHRDKYLVPIARGEHITTLSLSEPGTGVHFYLPNTQLTAVDGAYFVNGTKHFVTNGGHANSYVVSTRASDAAQGEFSCLVIDGNAPGIRFSGEWDGMGMRGNSSIMMHLENVRVPRESLLGEEGEQIWYVFEVIAPYFLIAMAGTYLGVAQAALDYTLNHVRTRVHSHSGEALSTADVIQHKLGEIWSRIEATRQLIYYAAAQADAGNPDALPAVLSAKAEIADVAVAVVNDCMTLCGGVAYRENSTLARLLRDVRASHVMAPTTDLLRLWTGRAILGQPLL
ncbi:MAG TPA: acyl-CoA dehydrogenase family protein [Thermoanaerobaculia bacterium]|nr:acyl-CoA dehydrogenase family protein [Thermoanaerobaculia bacterium]